jgi:hypothetical protein
VSGVAPPVAPTSSAEEAEDAAYHEWVDVHGLLDNDTLFDLLDSCPDL